jgi:hypothetical protein
VKKMEETVLKEEQEIEKYKKFYEENHQEENK